MKVVAFHSSHLTFDTAASQPISCAMVSRFAHMGFACQPPSTTSLFRNGLVGARPCEPGSLGSKLA